MVVSFYEGTSASLLDGMKRVLQSSYLSYHLNFSLRIDYGDGHVVRSSSTKRGISQLLIMIS